MNEQKGLDTNKQADEFTDADKREANIHNFDEEAEVQGTLETIEQGTYGNQYKIKDAADNEILVGSYGVLESKIKPGDVNKKIKIVFLGNKKSPKTNRTYRDFDVYIKD